MLFESKTKKLFRAIKRRDLPTARRLLETPDGQTLAKIKSSENITPLQAAMSVNMPDIVALLLEKGADISQMGGHYDTFSAFDPFFRLESDQRSHMLQACASASIDKKRKAEILSIFLLQAVIQNDLDVIKCLYELGANTGTKPCLHTAVEKGHNKAARLMIEAGESVDVFLKDSKNYVLHTAAAHNNIDMIREIYGRMENPHIVNKDGNTALHIAIIHKNFLAVELLLSLGAKTDVRNNDGETPVTLAEKSGHQPIIDIVKKKQAPQASKKNIDVEKWERAGETSVIFTGIYPEQGKKLTQMFNFAAEERLTTFSSISAATEPEPKIEKFTEISTAAIEYAYQEYKKADGKFEYIPPGQIRKLPKDPSGGLSS